MSSWILDDEQDRYRLHDLVRIFAEVEAATRDRFRQVSWKERFQWHFLKVLQNVSVAYRKYITGGAHSDTESHNFTCESPLTTRRRTGSSIEQGDDTAGREWNSVPLVSSLSRGRTESFDRTVCVIPLNMEVPLPPEPHASLRVFLRERQNIEAAMRLALMDESEHFEDVGIQRHVTEMASQTTERSSKVLFFALYGRAVFRDNLPPQARVVCWL